MSEELKWGLVIGWVVVFITGGMFASCNYHKKLDSEAPVVETCIKHPVTRSPLQGIH